MSRQPAARQGAAAASLVLGLGFGLPCFVGLVHFARTGEVWRFLGFPTYGEGPFERIGLHTSVPLLSAFLAVCAAEVVLAGQLVAGRARATGLAVVLLLIETVFWIGFVLPAGPPLGIARAALAVQAGRRAASPDRRRVPSR